jgi:amidohydrolase
LIFQPAEENNSGARTMIQDGLFERFPVDAVFGLHNWPGVPTGQFAFLDGPAMASVDLVVIKIQGRGGHGAKPHQAIDPIVVSASLIMALQTVVSRNVDPLEMAVVTVGSIHGGNAPNVIPDSVELQLTVRTFSAAVRETIRHRLTALAKAQAESFSATAEVFYPRGYPVLVNHPAETEFARQVARRHFGDERIDTHSSPSRRAKTLPSCWSSAPAAICSSAMATAPTCTIPTTISTTPSWPMHPATGCSLSRTIWPPTRREISGVRDDRQLLLHHPDRRDFSTVGRATDG